MGFEERLGVLINVSAVKELSVTSVVVTHDMGSAYKIAETQFALEDFEP